MENNCEIDKCQEPEVQTGNLLPDNTATYQLYDRVVNIREAYTVPFGCKGTVIGIQGPSNSGEDDIDVMLDVVFDEAFPGGLQLNCSSNRGYRVPKTAVINISHGMRSLQQKSVNSVTVTNNAWQHNKSPRDQQFNNNNSVQSQNSAFASWNPNNQAPPNNNYHHYRPPPPALIPQQQPRMFLPSSQNQHSTSHPVFTPALNHHRMPIAPPNTSNTQSLQQRPQQSGPPVSAEFLAFFQDLQKNQDKNKLSSVLPSQSLMEQKLSSKGAPFAITSKSPQHLKKDSTEETEALKKMLNICAKNSPKKSASSSSSQKNISQQISVQDLFTHARNKEHKLIQQTPPKTPGYTVQLLHYCQTQGIGVPRYCYFPSNNNRIRAQVTLQDGRMVIGDETTSREDAAEMAAKIIMNDVAQMKSFSPPKPHYSQRHPIPANDPGNPKIFPVPPKQWYQKANQQKPYNKQNNSNMSPRQQPQVVVKSLNINQVQQKELGKPGEKQATSFVPLQAVKKQRNKSLNEPHDMNQKKENNAFNMNMNENVEKNKSISAISKNSQSQSLTNTTPKQKQRRSRIAANFSGLQGQK